MDTRMLGIDCQCVRHGLPGRDCVAGPRLVSEVSALREAGRLPEDQAYSELMRLFSAYKGGWSVAPHRPTDVGA